ASEKPGAALVGAWSLNHELSDQPQEDDRSGRRGDRAGGGGSGRGGGGFGRGGGRFGGGGFGRGGGQEQGRGGEEMMRTRNAMRDLMTPAEHLTIVQTDTTIVLTAQDGRTTRLAPGGKKIKDDNTGVERQTKWDQ